MKLPLSLRTSAHAGVAIRIFSYLNDILPRECPCFSEKDIDKQETNGYNT